MRVLCLLPTTETYQSEKNHFAILKHPEDMYFLVKANFIEELT